ncbi:MvaI/BcnI family restriction endonuclease [Peribacillus butanolivorans]|uniref:MvaI/BcnI family restriction endonuclease n=1 Tax=Peribacillus butanolivorans TaxID=421767 RepID=UPI003699D59C
MQFNPNSQEQELIQKVLKVYPQEYSLVRLTATMLTKSIIDASALIRTLLKQGNVVDYENIVKGPNGKVLQDVVILSYSVNNEKASFYRPLTKKGDPRFWIYGLKSFISNNEMILLTVFNNQLVIIPLTQAAFDLKTIQGFFGIEENLKIKEELIELISALKARGPVLSETPNARAAKDVGRTLERELGILPNSDKLADFKSKIELKAKRSGMKTKDTLFSMVPDWTISSINSSPQMLKTYGYPSKKYTGYTDLFVTVNNEKNNQGLYLELDEENGFLHQFHEDMNSGKKTKSCTWKLEEIKKRLYNKHPETVWIVAEEIVIDGKIHFHYKQASYTRTPIFSSFLLLLAQGKVTYDWRGRVRTDGTGYKDKGHCFRVLPKYRHLLFTEIETISL